MLSSEPGERRFSNSRYPSTRRATPTPRLAGLKQYICARPHEERRPAARESVAKPYPGHGDVGKGWAGSLGGLARAATQTGGLLVDNWRAVSVGDNR